MVRAGNRMTSRSILAGLCAVVLGATLLTPARAAEKPLSSDDVILMLLAGASSDKMLSLIEQRGVDFRMNPDLAQKFHNAGADDLVIETLQKAVVKPAETLQSPARPSPPDAPAPAAPPASRKETPPPATSAKRGAPSDGDSYPFAPAVALVDLSGQKVSLADLKGQVVALNFWATWCPRCRAAIPRLMDLQDKYRAQGLRIIGLSIDESPKAVRKYFEMQAVNYPVAMADFKTRRDFGGISGVPTTILIGRDGRIYFTRVGAPEGAGLSHYLESEIKMLLNSPGKSVV